MVSLVNAQRQHALADRARRLRDHAETSAPVPEDESDPWTLGRNLDEGGWLRDLDHLRLAARSRLEWRGAEAAAAQAGAQADHADRLYQGTYHMALANYSECAPEIGRRCWAYNWCHGSEESRALHYTQKEDSK